VTNAARHQAAVGECSATTIANNIQPNDAVVGLQVLDDEPPVRMRGTGARWEGERDGDSHNEDSQHQQSWNCKTRASMTGIVS